MSNGVVRKMILHGAPPTNMPSEHIFNTVGNIFTVRKARLSPENAQKLDN